MNLQEDFCSQELYKLLIDKGFEVNCYDAPFTQRLVTHQSAMKWLREVHNIIIVIEPHSYNHIDEKTSSYDFSIWWGDNYDHPLTTNYPTYEEAVEAAIKYSLNFI